MAKWKSTKGQIKIYITLHRKQKIEQHEPHYKPRANSGAPEGYEVSTPLVAHVVLFHVTDVELTSEIAYTCNNQWLLYNSGLVNDSLTIVVEKLVNIMFNMIVSTGAICGEEQGFIAATI